MQHSSREVCAVLSLLRSQLEFVLKLTFHSCIKGRGLLVDKGAT